MKRLALLLFVAALSVIALAVLVANVVQSAGFPFLVTIGTVVVLGIFGLLAAAIARSPPVAYSAKALGGKLSTLSCRISRVTRARYYAFAARFTSCAA